MTRIKKIILISLGFLFILLTVSGLIVHLGTMRNNNKKEKSESTFSLKSIDFSDFTFNNSIYTEDVCRSITSISVDKGGKSVLVKDYNLCEQILRCLASADIGDEIKDKEVYGFHGLDFCIHGKRVPGSLNANMISFNGRVYELKDNTCDMYYEIFANI